MAILTTLVNFNGADGANPSSDLLLDAAGDLFGTTGAGGTYNDGTVFELVNNGGSYTLNTLVSFNGTDGSGPSSALTTDAEGDLFGTTGGGGTSGHGTVFEIPYTGGAYANSPTTIVSFNGADGSDPIGGVIADAAGDLFGTTNEGGTGTVEFEANGDGTVFEIAKTADGYAGTPTTLVDFDITNGLLPFGGLVADADGNMFGTTYDGGTGGSNPDGNGTVFELVNNGGGGYSFTTLVSFDGLNGFLPTGNLVIDAAGDLFGTTAKGGSGPSGGGLGTVFEIIKTATGYANTPIKLTAFGGYDGFSPAGTLIEDAKGNLFGTTALSSAGYPTTGGTVFELAKTGPAYNSTPTTLITFDGTDGTAPNSGVIADAAGDLFGTTLEDGAYGGGTVFEVFGSGYQVACYLRGTAIATPAGDRAIELLQVGDLVLTAAGAARPIIWIGQRSYAGRFAAGNRDVLPVVIRAGALAEAIPRRDLYVSPRHSMYLDGLLIPADALVNGVSIQHLEKVDSVAYFHIELETHDVLLAEGAASESFVDDDSRGMFHNAAEFARLYPDVVRTPQGFCAPRVEEGEALEAVRRRLAERAGLHSNTFQSGPQLGHLESADRDQVIGWAWNGQPGDAATAVRILDNGNVIAHVVANRHRRDLETAGIGNGRHGFAVTIPGGLSPFEPHFISVQYELGGGELPGSPVMIEAARHFDADTERHIAALIDGLPKGSAQERALSFMAAQLDRLLQLQADAKVARADRLAHAQFRRRWGPDVANIPTDSRAIDPGRRALVIDCRAPVATRDAGSLVILSHMRALQHLGYAVSFAPADMVGPQPALRGLTDAGIAVCGPPFYASIEEVLHRQSGCVDVVYLHRADIADRYMALVRAHMPRARILYNVADLAHLRLARAAEVEARPELLANSRWMRAVEQRAAITADAVLTHSSKEAEILRRAVPPGRVHIVPWEVPVREPRLPFASRTGVAFIGGYGHAPNLDAAYWLVNEVMPLVWQVEPDIDCWLVGSEMPDRMRQLAGPCVRMIGHVEDLGQSVFDRVRLTVAPLRYGAGIKGKVVTSFAAGVPCVMSDIAAEGLALPPALQALICRNATELASRICHMHGNAAANQAASIVGLSWVRQHFTLEQTEAVLQAAIGGGKPVARALGHEAGRAV